MAQIDGVDLFDLGVDDATRLIELQLMVLGCLEQLKLRMQAPVPCLLVLRELIAFSLFVYELTFARVLHV